MGLTNIVLWKYQKNKNGESPIFIRIIEERKSRYIKTGLYALEDDWDFKESRFKTKYRKVEDLEKAEGNLLNNELLDKKQREAEKLIKELMRDDKLISSEQVKQEIVKAKNVGKQSVLRFIDHIILEKNNSNKLGTAATYKDLNRALKKFLTQISKSDISFKEITITFLRSFEHDFKSRNVKETSISVYMRTLRAVFNRAIEEGICKKEMYPFDTYKVSQLNTQTTKRAIRKEDIEKIKGIELTEDSRMFHSRNYFLFSYYNRGINFSDIAFLKWENIRENRMTYVRLKTNNPFNILLLEPAIQIINHYKANFYFGANSYIFPILNVERHTNLTSIKNRIHKLLTQTNQDLKELGNMVGIEIPLTTYVARHTYATVMKKSGQSTSIISEALGHDSERTTQIYLDSFENDILDEASKAIL
jgi:site-specific recombinase XerD